MCKEKFLALLGILKLPLIRHVLTKRILKHTRRKNGIYIQSDDAFCLFAYIYELLALSPNPYATCVSVSETELLNCAALTVNHEWWCPLVKEAHGLFGLKYCRHSRKL